MSDRVTGSAAAAVGAHSRDAAEARGSADRPPQGGERGGEDLSGTLRGVADQVSSAARDAGESATRMARDAGESATRMARQVGRQVYAQGAEAGEAARGAVRDYPIPALLMAGAIGLAFGILLARR